MKKLLSLLLAVPMLTLVTACDDDDDKNIPDVSVSIEYSGATLTDNTLYVVQGEPLTIEGLVVTPAPGTGKAVLGNTTYLMDGYPFFTTGVAPYGVVIDTDDLALGEHTLSVHSQIFQVDKSIGWGIFSYNLQVVESTDDQPDDTGGGTDVTPLSISDAE